MAGNRSHLYAIGLVSSICLEQWRLWRPMLSHRYYQQLMFPCYQHLKTLECCLPTQKCPTDRFAPKARPLTRPISQPSDLRFRSILCLSPCQCPGPSVTDFLCCTFSSLFLRRLAPHKVVFKACKVYNDHPGQPAR